MTALLSSALLLLLCTLPHTTHASPDRPWLTGTPTTLPFLSKEALSPDTELYHFGLPSPNMSLGISTCSCILVSPPSNLDLTRPYTPISTRHTEGTFTLLVKRYPQGAMSAVFGALQCGDSLAFRQIPFNLKIQYPFESPRCILMLAAGTGITPMYQVCATVEAKGG
jgi:cytochrome-b5 reductase